MYVVHLIQIAMFKEDFLICTLIPFLVKTWIYHMAWACSIYKSTLCMGEVHLSKYLNLFSLFIMMASLPQSKWKSWDWTCMQSQRTLRAMWDGCNQPGFLPASVLQCCSVAHAAHVLHMQSHVASQVGWFWYKPAWPFICCRAADALQHLQHAAVKCSWLLTSDCMLWDGCDANHPGLLPAAVLHIQFLASLLCCSQSGGFDLQSSCTLRARWDGCNQPNFSTCCSAALPNCPYWQQCLRIYEIENYQPFHVALRMRWL